ncbi:MAG TPA: SRPBCC family protein [Candidatus Saccharimonadales bacterium]|nr:SRPBCC family protein [Candidatus Saccharimonadales bacterium]
MRNVIKTQVAVPQAQLAKLLADPQNNPKWMVDLASFKPGSGKPGEIGSTYKLAFKSGDRIMEFDAKVTKRDLPNELKVEMKNPTVDLDAVARFTKISDSITEYTSDQTFTFKGLMGKIFGMLGSSSIKEQQKRDMLGFKEFAEKTYKRSQ